MGLHEVDQLWQTASRIRYRCGSCSRIHEGLPDIVFDAPHYFYSVPEDERAERCHLTSDLCVIDEQDFFVRCLLEIPITGMDERFGWGIWCSLSEKNFRGYQATYDEPTQSQIGPFFGWFSSRLPSYGDTLLLRCEVRPQDGGARPCVTLEQSDHELAIEQRNGMAIARAIGLAKRVGAKLVIG